ncbi:PIN domain-containing protein [Kumtagia ephedrae]|nr:type II toxin-antitoxin system VapC family toxin [Mesorhizobium ephedrae]
MIGVDTNVLLRFVVIEDIGESERAAAFFGARHADDPAFVSIVVLVEFIWVLRSRYRFSQDRVVFVIESLMSSPAFVFEEQHHLSTLLRGSKVKAGDLADHLIALSAARAGCSRTVTFDAAAASAIPLMELLA